MPGAVVGLYCAVVERLEPLVWRCASAACEEQVVFNQQADTLRAGLGALSLGSVQAAWQREPESSAARLIG